jgi:hypothetical protein
MYVSIHAKYPNVILVRFQRHVKCLDRFSMNTQISNFMKICPVGTRCFMRMDGNTDRQTDRHDEANSRHSQFRERA